MSVESVQIIPCPPDRYAEALALVLRKLEPAQRREIASQLLGRPVPLAADAPGLLIALSGEQLLGAVWGQRHPGNTAVLWPPQMIDAEEEDIAQRLLQGVNEALDAAGIGMTQVLLSSRHEEVIGLLESSHFYYLADLLYLVCEASSFPSELPNFHNLQFEAYCESQRQRLFDLIEQTYEGTQDCPELNNARKMEDVIDGYQATGIFNPAIWYFVRSEDQDVGVLLHADYPETHHWELIYMGIVPPSRGQGWGKLITRQAQWLAKNANVERIVLAVDAANHPALAMYREADYVVWDQRTVFIRTASQSP